MSATITTEDSFDDVINLIRESWEKKEAFLENIPFFHALGHEKLRSIAQNIHIKHYVSGQILLHEHEMVNLFFIVTEGQAKCYKSDGSDVPICVFKCGDFFGGNCLFNNSPTQEKDVRQEPTGSGAFPMHSTGTHRKHTGRWKQYSSRNFLGFFPMISDRFPPETTGNSQEFIGKKFPPEYCFHFRCFPAEYGDFSAPFLQDTVAGIFVLGSTATIEAEDDLTCFVMTRDEFEKELAPVVNKLKQAATHYQTFIEKQI